MTKTMMMALVALSAMSRAAWADGAGQVVGQGDLEPASYQVLQAGIAEARRADPGAFAAVAAVRGHRPEAYLKTRLRKPNVVSELRALGARALWPMLDALTAGLPGQGALAAAEQRALEVGLLDAVGALADVRAEAVLQAAFEKSSPHVIATAALGLGRLCSGGLERALDGARGAAVGAAALRGVGECRRPASIDRISAVAARRKLAGDELGAAAQSLGKLGGAWALDAEVLAGKRTRAEADAMRRGASAALTTLQSQVQLLARKDPAAAQALRHARTLIDGK